MNPSRKAKGIAVCALIVVWVAYCANNSAMENLRSENSDLEWQIDALESDLRNLDSRIDDICRWQDC